ncbi:MAG: hypothetical protein N2578_05470 [Bdellovibrionaceae bacterium]|nr:hypothetical protein [Pseudobdellovibrionaceae bacterium]
MFVNFVRYVFFPLAKWSLIFLSPLLSKKVKQLVRDKRKPQFQSNRTPRPGQPIWVHAASGEVEYARPVLRELSRLLPQCPLLVTYTSPSAIRILRNIPEADWWGAAPWDTPWDVENFIEQWRPRVALFARTDVWPNTAFTLQRHGIPSLLFSATFSPTSSRLSSLSAIITEASLNKLNMIYCVSNVDRSLLFSKLKISTPVEVRGDTRFDQVFYRLDHPKPVRSIELPSKQIIVAGSTWPEDEEVLLPALRALPEVRLLLAPHEIHPERIVELEQKLARLGMSFQLYSQANRWESDVLILDEIGILAEIYRWGDVAFVGGSFRRQVHSVMEPLACGLPVLVGPYHQNNREAVELQNQIYPVRAVVAVQSERELIEQLKIWLNTRPTKEQIRNLIQGQMGASLAVAEWCQKSAPV